MYIYDTEKYRQCTNAAKLQTPAGREWLGAQLEAADPFTPLPVGPFNVTKHRGEGYWVDGRGCRFAVTQPAQALDLIQGLLYGKSDIAWHAAAGTVFYQGQFLKDQSRRQSYNDGGDFFQATLTSNRLEAIYQGIRNATMGGSQLAAVVQPL